MTKTCVNSIYIILIFSTILFSCKKDSGNLYGDDNTLLISVNSLIALEGQDWNVVQPNLSNKRGYWYTEFSQDQAPGVKAAISLPANDTSNGVITHCTILLNVDRLSNKISSQIMNTNDTLSPLTQEQSYALQSYYYINGLKPLTDTVKTYGFYDDGTGFQKPTTVTDISTKLMSNYTTPALGISYTTSSYSNYSIVCFKNSDNNRYTFSFRANN